MILLDTCGLLALQNGGKALSPEARSRLEAPGSRVFISAISAFEIGQKQAAGKLTLPCEPDAWFQGMLKQHQVEEIPVTSTTCFAATSLPPIHKDPFDRIIIATAHQHRHTILTSDQIIPTYPDTPTLW